MCLSLTFLIIFSSKCTNVLVASYIHVYVLVVLMVDIEGMIKTIMHGGKACQNH